MNPQLINAFEYEIIDICVHILYVGKEYWNSNAFIREMYIMCLKWDRKSRDFNYDCVMNSCSVCFKLIWKKKCNYF